MCNRFRYRLRLRHSTPLPVSEQSYHPASLANVRQALTPFSPGTHFFDRRAMLADLQNDPLYLNLIGILDSGAITVLLLALVGATFASWSNARTRLVHFAVLRAYGIRGM